MADTSLATLLAQFQPHFSTICPLPENRRRISAMAQRLPALSGGGLECHLGAVNRTDLMLRLGRFDRGRDALAARCGDLLFADLDQPDWLPLRRFAAGWNQPASALYSAVDNVWLEFDMPEEGRGISGKLPSVFFEVNRQQRLTQEQQFSVIQSGLQMLSPDSLHYSSDVEKILNATPSGVFLDYAGIMLMRDNPGVRLCLSGFETTGVVDWLRSVDWAGEFETLEKLLGQYADTADKLIVDLDVSGRPQSGLGIELFWWQDNAWQQVLRMLVEEGWCTENQAVALMAWPGYSEFTAGDFRYSLAEAQDTSLTMLIRRFNHLKFSLHTNRQLEVKAYVYFGYA